MILFGDRLIAWRERKGMTQEVLSAKSGVSVSTISRLESRIDENKQETKPNNGTKAKLAQGLGVLPEDLDRMPPPLGGPSDEELLASKDQILKGVELLAAKGDVTEIELLRLIADMRLRGVIK
jgi:transcriptional regulator with XRE-family HTH domain